MSLGLIGFLFLSAAQASVQHCAPENHFYVQGNTADPDSPTGTKILQNVTEVCVDEKTLGQPNYATIKAHVIQDGNVTQQKAYLAPVNLSSEPIKLNLPFTDPGHLVTCTDQINREPAETLPANHLPTVKPVELPSHLQRAMDEVENHQTQLTQQQEMIQTEVQKAIEKPQGVLSFMNQSVSELRAMAQTFQNSIAHNSPLLYNNQTEVHQSDLKQINRLTESALGNALKIQTNLNQALAQSKQFMPNSPLMTIAQPIFGPKEQAALDQARGAILNKPTPAGTDQAQAQSIMQFAGLSDDVRKALQQRLFFVEQIKNKSGEQATVLHSGYLLGDAKSAMDCSRWISSLIAHQRLTTQDLRAIWIYLVEGKFPESPTYTPAQQGKLKRLAKLLQPINVYSGELPSPGDLLVHRISEEKYGHVVLVKSFDFYSYLAWVLEAAQTSRGLQERQFPLSMDSAQSKFRAIRPGLYVLRPKPEALQGAVFEADLAQN